MKAGEFSNKEARAKIEKMLSGAKIVYMGTNGSHGHPNIRAVSPAKIEGVETIWFVTDLNSSKIIELVKDNKAVVYALGARMVAECRLWGYVTILDDAASKKSVWHDDLKKHLFPDGVNSSSLRVLRFDVSNGYYSSKGGKCGEFKN
ncbi:MAG: pyridoxamine 5'-phosphate oxidase family protein [Synergistaceae bacterium]|jgi:general stress protein 26|nr:pyridoxamine 5'-phosphate oxidase family protein [Synergistaceae bacterium]